MTIKLTSEEVRALFDYRDGSLYWRINPRKRPTETKAGTVNSNGYIIVTYKGQKMQAHRLVWMWHGRDLPEQIDHINGDTADNRIENLRAADIFTNAYNMRLARDNKSGAKNVSWCNTYGKWVVQIRKDGRKVVGRRFHDFDEAVRFAAEKRVELHGEFARHG